MSSIGLIESTQEGDATVARVACRQIIDQTVMNGIFQRVSELSDSQTNGKLVVDLAGVEYMSGVTLSMFVMLDEVVSKGGNQIGFCQLSPAVDELFRVSRFHKVVKVFSTRSEAINGLGCNGHQKYPASKLSPRRQASTLAAGERALVGASDSSAELLSGMSGILPGLMENEVNESTLVEIDRAELLASNLPTFAEPVEDSAEVEFDESDSLGDSQSVVLTAPEEAVEPVVVIENVSVAGPVSQRLPNPVNPSDREIRDRVMFSGCDDDDSPEINFDFRGDSVAEPIQVPGSVQTNPPRNKSNERGDILEADWAEIFEKAEQTEECESDFVVEQKSEPASHEKPLFVEVETTNPSSAQAVAKATPIAPSQQPQAEAFPKPSSKLSSQPVSAGGRTRNDSRSTELADGPESDAVLMRPGDSALFDPARAEIVGQRHVQLSAFMRERKFDAILLSQPSSIAWFTAGGESPLDCGNEPTASLLITPESRFVLGRNIDAKQLLEHEIADLGFELIDRLWYEDRQTLLDRVVRDKAVAADQPHDHCIDLSPRLARLRLPLSETECGKLRELGRAVSHCVEFTASRFQRGETEYEVAGQIMHRLVRQGVTPLRIQVVADGHNRFNRESNFGARQIDRYCTISVVGRRRGLHIALSRTVCFGPAPSDLRDAHQDALLAQTTGIVCSEHNWDLYEPWSRVERVYERYGHAEEWLKSEQGCVTGYELCEAPIVPRSQFRLSAGMPMIWRCAIGPAMAIDTILVRESTAKVLTKMEEWPKITIKVRETKLARPDILIRPE